MKNILLAGFLLFTNALAEQFKEAAFLELPLPDERVDEFLNGQALILKSKNVLTECAQKLDLTHHNCHATETDGDVDIPLLNSSLPHTKYSGIDTRKAVLGGPRVRVRGFA